MACHEITETRLYGKKPVEKLVQESSLTGKGVCEIFVLPIYWSGLTKQADSWNCATVRPR